MRISDWSSDVCSSDLLAKALRQLGLAEPRSPRDLRHRQGLPPAFADQLVRGGHTLGVNLAERRLAMEFDHSMLFERAAQLAEQFEAARGAEHTRAFALDRKSVV